MRDMADALGVNASQPISVYAVSLMSGCIAVTAMYRAVFHNAGTRASFRCWLYPDSWNNSFGGTVLRLEPLAKDKHAYMVQM